MDLVKITVDALRGSFGLAAAAYALSAIGLNLQFGYTGLINLGHIASMLVGAYGTAIVVDAGGSLVLGVLVGLASAVVLGLVWGLPTLRLRADYLAIVTLSGAEILRYLVRSQWAEGLTGSVYGIQRFADAFYRWNPFGEGSYGFSIASNPLRYSERQLWVMVVCWGLVIAATVVIALLVHSPWGRALRAIREDEEVARSLGKNVFGFKLQSLMIGGVIGALAGAMLAIETQNVHPDFYIPVFTMFVFAVLLLGGPGTIWGPVVGSIVFWLLFEWFDGFIVAAIRAGWFGDLLSDIDAGPLRTVLLGAGLILLVVFRPQGILGNRTEVMLDDT